MDNHRFKSGFVSIVGRPNVGKSTLMNTLTRDNLSIITSKAQTTRHRIMGILTGDNFQVIYSDTPGLLKPQYALQQSMMRFVNVSLEDADLVLYVVDLMEKQETEDEVLERIIQAGCPMILVINKSDLDKGSRLEDKQTYWQSLYPKADIVAVSALHKQNIETLFDRILAFLPIHPPYFPEDALTDKPEKFFVAEMIREQIFLNYREEVPYSTEVDIVEFKESADLIRIRGEIFVERASQKGIILGKAGQAIKIMSTAARLRMETFFGKKIFLETFVKVAADWRRQPRFLQKFGYPC